MEYGIGSGPIFLKGVDCDGDEHSLLACDTHSNLPDQCTHHNDIGVFCQSKSIPTCILPLTNIYVFSTMFRGYVCITKLWELFLV